MEDRNFEIGDLVVIENKLEKVIRCNQVFVVTTLKIICTGDKAYIGVTTITDNDLHTIFFETRDLKEYTDGNAPLSALTKLLQNFIKRNGYNLETLEHLRVQLQKSNYNMEQLDELFEKVAQKNQYLKDSQLSKELKVKSSQIKTIADNIKVVFGELENSFGFIGDLEDVSIVNDNFMNVVNYNKEDLEKWIDAHVVETYHNNIILEMDFNNYNVIMKQTEFYNQI